MLIKNNKKFIYISLFLAFICGVNFIQPAFSEEQNLQNETPEKTTIAGSATQFDVISDRLDYVVEENQFVATGNASVTIKENDSKLKADKITFDQIKNTIVAEGHVRIIKDGSVIRGDFTRVDLNKESVLISKPITQFDIIHLNANEAYVYSNDVIEAFNGTATIDKKINMCLSSYQMGSNKKEMFKEATDEDANSSKRSNYKIVTKNIIIKGSKEKNIVKIINAQVYRGKVKVANIPSLELTADKEMTQVETSLPEIGHNQQIGYYFGPGYVFHVPGGSTLKAAPLITGGTGGVGIGGLLRHTSSTNRTEVVYGTTKEEFLVEGEQKLFENTKLVYGQNAYINDGILGRRRPDYLVEVVHETPYYIKDLDLQFTSRLSGGYAQDYNKGWGTSRFKAQGNILNKNPLFAFAAKNQEIDYNWFEFRVHSQYDVTIYGSGDRFALIRVGPRIDIRKGPAWLGLTYFQSGVHGNTPFDFDRYYYGKSNLTIYSNIKLTDKLDLGYIGYLNLNKDNWDKKLLAENQIYARIGSDDLKFKIGYDSVREATVFGVDLMIGSESTAIDFEKMKIINPRELSNPKEKKESKTVNL